MSKIKRIFPEQLPLPVFDPFVFTMYHEDKYPAATSEMTPATSKGQGIEWNMYYGETIPGFPVHPHRGFETLTVVEKGMIDHADGLGTKGRYGDGDVQWMTAGRGLQHAEMFPLLQEQGDNTLKMFQIWVNLPHSHKMVEPNYKMIWNEEVPVVTREENGAKTSVRVITGTFEGVRAPSSTPDSWAYDPAHHVGVFVVTLDPKARVSFPAVSPTLSRMIYAFDGGGAIDLDGHTLPFKHMAHLDGNAPIEVTNKEDNPVRFILMEGEPINENVVARGPFVMNTMEEILQAYHDYRQTEFGGWPHDRPDPVLGKNEGRYILDAQGNKTLPPRKKTTTSGPFTQKEKEPISNSR